MKVRRKVGSGLLSNKDSNSSDLEDNGFVKGITLCITNPLKRLIM